MTLLDGKEYWEQMLAFEAGKGPKPEFDPTLELISGLFRHEYPLSVHTQIYQVVLQTLIEACAAQIEEAGGTILEGTCFYNQYAREIGEANGWVRLLSNSAKIVNILGGYGYKPALATMEDCVASAIEGVIQ